MRKYTRKHYNKKLVALGLSAFMGIGLTSTGFAAWVMSKDAELSTEGGVNVAVIEDASVKINLTEGTYDTVNSTIKLKDNFVFDSKSDDVSGRIRAKAGQTGEDLRVTVTGKVDTDDVAYDLTAKITFILTFLKHIR